MKKQAKSNPSAHTRTRALNVCHVYAYALHLTPPGLGVAPRRVHKEPGVKPKAERPKRHERKRRNVNATPLGWHMTTPFGGCHIVVGGLKASPQRFKKKKKMVGAGV